jgi:hypothetical protein
MSQKVQGASAQRAGSRFEVTQRSLESRSSMRFRESETLRMMSLLRSQQLRRHEFALYLRHHFVYAAHELYEFNSG